MGEVYEYKEHFYEICDSENSKMKCPETGKWCDAVLYKDWFGNPLAFLIRTKISFFEKYIPISQEEATKKRNSLKQETTQEFLPCLMDIILDDPPDGDSL